MTVSSKAGGENLRRIMVWGGLVFGIGALCMAVWAWARVANGAPGSRPGEHLIHALGISSSAMLLLGMAAWARERYRVALGLILLGGLFLVGQIGAMKVFSP